MNKTLLLHTTVVQPSPRPAVHAPLVPVSEVKRSSVALDEFAVNVDTGQLYLTAENLELRFPMLVVRHGQTNGNVRRIFQGQLEIPESQLNEVGLDQAHKAAGALYEELAGLLGEELHDFAASGKLIILHSPMARAHDTTAAFLDHFERQTGIALTASPEPKLAEIHFGDIEGLSVDEIHDEALQRSVAQFKAHQDATVDWEGSGESFLDVVIRAKHLLEDLNSQYGNQDVLVLSFAHGTLINALRTVVGDDALLETDGQVAFRKHHVNNAEAYWLGHSQQLAAQLPAMWRELQDKGEENHV